jgi:type I restriction enzyme S subunit
MSKPVVEAEHEGRKVARLGPRQVPIPEDWEAVPFEEAVELNPSYDKQGEGPFDFLPMDAVNEEMQTIEYWNEREKSDCTTTWFKNGDTVYAKITPCTENGKIAFIDDLTTEVGSGSTEFLVFHPREGITDERFVYYLANLPEFRAVTISLMEGSTGRQRVPTDVFAGGLEVPLPPLPEQRRIADVLSTVDEQIQQAGESINETAELKRGLMQDLYTSGTRESPPTQSTKIGDLPGDWNLSTIGDYAEIVSGTHVKSDLVSDDPSQTPYITGPADFTRRGINVTKYTDHPSSFCEEGDTLITVKGMSCGKSTLADSRVSISRQLKAVRPSDELDEKYLFYWVRYKEQLLHILAEGTRQLGLSTSDISTFPLPIPPLHEQESIGDILFTVDERLSEEREYRNELSELKRGLMQDLLTGQRRLEVDA